MLGVSREFEEALRSLSPHQQRILLLRYLCRMPAQQVQEAQTHGEEHLRRLFSKKLTEQQIPLNKYSWLV